MRRMSVWSGVVALAFAAATACTGADRRAGSFEAMADTDPMGWSRAAEIEYENRDTTALSDLSIVVRYGSDADADALRLSLTVTAPDSAYTVEHLIIPLSRRPKAASVASLDAVPYRRAVRLSQEGVYRFALKPADEVRGIEAVGISIHKN